MWGLWVSWQYAGMAEPMTLTDHEPWIPEDTFGSRLAQVRQALGMNVTTAAKACGLSAENWRQWEHGRSPRRMDTVARTVADTLRVDYVWLLTGLRSRCFTVVEPLLGQLDLGLFDTEPVLTAV